jgi:hypothetical protein
MAKEKMDEFGQNKTQSPAPAPSSPRYSREGRLTAEGQAVERPGAVTVFGVLNIVVGCYFMVRIVYSWYELIVKYFKNPEEIIGSGILYLLLFFIVVGLVIWLIVLGIGLLKMKRWARRGSVLYGWIQVVFIVLTLGASLISLVADYKNLVEGVKSFISIGNGLAIIRWIYMVLLLIFMKTAKVKQVFGE